MKHFIKQIIIFFLTTIVGWFILVFIVANIPLSLQKHFEAFTNIPANAGTPGESTSVRFKEIKNYSDVDIVLIGSSHVYRGFDPRIFEAEGYQIFNMGSNDQTNINTYYLLEEYIDKLNPKLVVFEVFGRILSWDGLISSIDISLTVPEFSSNFEMALATENFKAINFYLTEKLRFTKRSLELYLLPYDTYISRGYVERELSYRGVYEIDTMTVKVWQKQVDYMNKIIQSLLDREIDVLLIELPVTDALQKATLNFDELRELIDQTATNHGIEFINLNNYVEFNDTIHFYDEDHLNQTGVKQVCKKLIELLKNRNLPKKN